MLSQKSDDGPHIAVKTQGNNTPNGSLQYTQVTLKDWAVFIIPSSYYLHIRPLSNTTPKECVFWGQLQYTQLFPYGPLRYLQLPAPLWCCVDWHNRLAQVLHIFVLPSSNFSFIWIVVLTTHYAVCQPLQLSPCQQVHLQVVINLQWSSLQTLSSSISHEAGSLILVSSMRLTHPHNSGFNFTCSGSWSNASDAPTLSRTLLVQSPCPNAF